VCVRRFRDILISRQAAGVERRLPDFRLKNYKCRIARPDPEIASRPPGNLSNTLQNLLYTRPEGEASAGLVKLLGAAAENDSESNTGEPPASNGEDGAGALQVAAAGQGGTKATQKQKAAQPQKGQPPQAD
jgi:hypothetical protein